MRIAVIGGGAAGFFAAINIKEKFPTYNVTIFEGSQDVMSKLLLTGGGRCNLTNTFENVKDLKNVYPRGNKLMKRLFKTFDNQGTYSWFTSRGINLYAQDDDRVFPSSNDSHTIVDFFLEDSQRLGINIAVKHKLIGLIKSEDVFHLTFDSAKEVTADKVVVTTGGHHNLSSYSYLADLGHEVVSPVPSLFTFNVKDEQLHLLTGTSVPNVTVGIPSQKMRAEGSLLITHWGFSGPATLRLSSYFARYIHEKNYKFQISINWTGESNQTVRDALNNALDSSSNKFLSKIHPYGFSSRLWEYLLQRSGLPNDKRWNELGNKGMNKLTETLTNDIYSVDGKGKWKEEFVTAGGIALSSINLSTLESKNVAGLFFAGEILDIDAITGGFNLQAAWTTAFTVAQNL